MFIYEIRNLINNRRYIGQTTRQANRRWSEHVYNLNHNKHGNPHLQNAWNLHGSSNFIFNIIFTANNIDQLNDLEIQLVKEDNLYNIRSGGVLFRHNETTKRKISNSRKGIPAWNKGIHTTYMTDKTRNKLSIIQRPSGYPSITDVDGNIVDIINLRSTAKKLNIDQTGLRMLVNGKYNSYNGWTVVGTTYIPRNVNISKSKRTTNYPSLISPDGTIYFIEDTLRSFCKSHNLTISSMSRLINNKISSYKGWKLQENLRA